MVATVRGSGGGLGHRIHHAGKNRRLSVHRRKHIFHAVRRSLADIFDKNRFAQVKYLRFRNTHPLAMSSRSFEPAPPARN